MIVLADLPAESRPAAAAPAPSESTPPAAAAPDTAAPAPAPSPVPVAPAPPAVVAPDPLPSEPSSTLSEYDREVLRLNLDAAATPTPVPLARYGLSARLALGASYQMLYTVPITSGELELGFGGRARAQAAYVTVSVERGRTEFGLRTAGWHVGLVSEWSIGRFRYGFQVRGGAMFIGRVSEPGQDLSSGSLGARGHFSWDFVRFSGGDAFVAELGFRTDIYVPVVYGPSLLLGYRWESNHRLGGAH